jgi:hypothetical protein
MNNDKADTQENNDFLEGLFNKIDAEKFYNLEKTNKMNREIKYTTRTFYVKAEKIDTLVEFQEKCRNNGRRSYSEVLVELMENYNKVN